MDIDDSFGTFDYIIVHGIWSWVPDVVKDKILNICSRNLSGIVVLPCVSYYVSRLKSIRAIYGILCYILKACTLVIRTRTYNLYENVLKLISETMKLDERSTKISDYKIKI